MLEIADSFFRIVSSNDWQEAQITGIVPKNAADEKDGLIHVNQFIDLEKVCGERFVEQDYPIALEFAPDSYLDQLVWHDEDEDTPWRDGQISIDNLSADLVLRIYSFEHLSAKAGGAFKILGESQ